MEVIKTTCPLDCWDQCALHIRVEKGEIITIEPDPDQHVTNGFICSKGKRHADRVNHPERLRYPCLKRGRNFVEIGWTEAMEIMAKEINRALEQGGPQALLHYYDAGHSGLLKNIESRFFSALGGCTLHKGSLCWGAGLAAQGYDFGSVVAHPYHDLLNSELILLWGRNPAHTSVHLQSFIRRASQKGSRIVLIDPVKTATASCADRHIRVKPGTDGALALAMAGVIIERGLIDEEFISHCSAGFEQYADLCREYAPASAADLTGVEAGIIEELALEYAQSKPAAILIGIGPQRHSNGGNMVRAIDALAAITGNIGRPGGGASYANFRITGYIDHAYLNGDDLNPRRRYYPKPLLADSLLELDEPKIEFMYISRSNPLVQVGNSNRLKEAFSGVPFIVTAEHFMTDTAAASDLVLPATCFLEEVDIFFNSMSHQYLGYGNRVLDPPGECRSEYDVFRELAGMLGAGGFPTGPPDQILARAIRPLTEMKGITVADIKNRGPLLMPGGDDIPWADRVFHTADGKYHFYSQAAKEDGCDALPRYREPRELSDRSLHDKGYKYWFLTPHPRDSIHSIHRLPGGKEVPRAYLHPDTATIENLGDGMRARFSSPRGSIESAVTVSDRVPPGTVLVYEGWWCFSGAAVNMLTSGKMTDMGFQAAYYDCLCRIDPV